MMIFFTPQGSSPLGSFLDLVGPHPSVKRLITKLVPAPLFDIFLPFNDNILFHLHWNPRAPLSSRHRVSHSESSLFENLNLVFYLKLVL